MRRCYVPRDNVIAYVTAHSKDRELRRRIRDRAEELFRALGYIIEPIPGRASFGVRWSASTITTAHEKMSEIGRVRAAPNLARAGSASS